MEVAPSLHEKRPSGGIGNNIRWIPLHLKIMTIDEDPTSLFFVAKLLETCHYTVESFENPVNALDVLDQGKEKYDLVIMDLDCIAMPGFDLLHIVAKKMNIAVITICSDDSNKVRTQALYSGASFHIVKPITVNSLRFVWMKDWECSAKRKESRRQLNRRGKLVLGSNEHLKTRLHWDAKLHERFLVAVSLLQDEAVPMSIIGIMNVEGLTIKEVSSHLQKHRERLQKEKENNFTGLLLPLHQFPTSMNPFSRNMANTVHELIVIEDEEEWTLEELLSISDAPEAAQHDPTVGIDFDSDFLDFNFEFEFGSNNFVDGSEAAQHGVADSSNGCDKDFDFVTEFLEFDFENDSLLDYIFNDDAKGGM